MPATTPALRPWRRRAPALDDLSREVAPPNLGLFALRFPVSRLASVEARLAAAGWPLARVPARVRIAPYGAVRWLAVQAPDGAWLEFFETESRKP